MVFLRMQWRTEGSGRLAGEWGETGAKESYKPAWMQSLYPCERSTQRLESDAFSLSPFGKPAWMYSVTMPRAKLR